MLAFMVICQMMNAVAAPISAEEQRRRDLFLRSQQSPAKATAPKVNRRAPANRTKARPPQQAPPSRATPVRPPQASIPRQTRPPSKPSQSPPRQSYGYRGTAPVAQPVRRPQTRPPSTTKPAKRSQPAPARQQATPPPARTIPPRPPQAASIPQPPERVDLSTLAPPSRTTPPPEPKPRTRLFDHFRLAAQGLRTKLEDLPRTEQSRGIVATSKTQQPATAKAGPPRPVAPTSAARKPPGQIAKTTPTPRPPAKPATKPEPEPAALASAASKAKPPKTAAPTPPPAIGDTARDPGGEPLPVPPPPVMGTPTAPADAYSAIAGDSIFRSLAILASTTAMRVGSEALRTEITAVPASAGPVPTDVDTGFVAFKDIAPPRTPAVVAKVADTPIAPPAPAAKPSARAPATTPTTDEDGLGLSVDDVLDLTKADDDLPFIKHQPPTAATGASAGDLVISAVNQTDFDIASSEMEFSGNVQVKSPRFAMRCDRFIVHLKADGSGMDYGEGIGNVFIRMQQDGVPSGHEGFAHRAIYRPDQGKLTLSGWPKIRESHKEHVAATRDTQMVLYTDGRVKTLGRNRTVIRN